MQSFSQSPTDPGFVQDPYPVYDAMRAKGDVVFWEDYAMAAAVSHRAVRAIMTDKRFGRTPPPDKAPALQSHIATWMGIEAHSMLELEPPAHTRLRGLVLRAFTSRTVADLAPDIEAVARDLLDHVPAGPFDLLDHYAKPLPVRIIARLLGVPDAAAPDLLAWSNAMVAMYQAGRTPQVEAAAERAAQDFSAFLADIIAHKRRTPDDSLLSTLIAARDAGDKLSDAELTSTAILLLNAGHEATVHTLGNGVLALSRYGWPAITDTTIEEILRFDPPLHMFTRWVYEDVDLFGTRLAAGTEVACMLAAANRDPAVFDAPSAFTPTRPRKANPHLSFGAGIHFCVGAPLARLELDIGLRHLRAALPDMSLVAPPEYGDTYHFHGLRKVMVQA